MSCVSCLESQNSRRFNSAMETGPNRLCCIGVDRSWSGNLTPPRYEQIQYSSGSTAVANKMIRKSAHRRLHSAGAYAFEGRNSDKGEPRLLRSGGMRRDWSFEDLRQRREEQQKRNEGSRVV